MIAWKLITFDENADPALNVRFYDRKMDAMRDFHDYADNFELASDSGSWKATVTKVEISSFRTFDLLNRKNIVELQIIAEAGK